MDPNALTGEWRLGGRHGWTTSQQLGEIKRKSKQWNQPIAIYVNTATNISQHNKRAIKGITIPALATVFL